MFTTTEAVIRYPVSERHSARRAAQRCDSSVISKVKSETHGPTRRAERRNIHITTTVSAAFNT